MYSRTTAYLEKFDNQHDFERMCADILNALGYGNVVLVAPRGGSDGGRDIEFTTESGAKGLACVTLRKDIDAKFKEDFHQRKPGDYARYMLFCTAHITASKKLEFARYCLDTLDAEFVPQDIEAVRSLLDSILRPIRATWLYDGDASSTVIVADARQDGHRLGAAFTNTGVGVAELGIVRRQVRIPSIQQYRDELTGAASKLSKQLGPSDNVVSGLDASVELAPDVPPLQDEIERIIAEIVDASPRLPQYGQAPRIYLRRYVIYLDRLYRYVDGRARSHQVGLRVLNEGTSAAQDVVVEVIAPEGCRLRRVGTALVMPREPRPPFRLFFRALGFAKEDKPPLTMSAAVRPDLPHEDRRATVGDDIDMVKGPLQTPHEPARLTYEVKRILHNIPVDVAPFVLVVPRLWDGDRLRVECRVHVDGQPIPAQAHIDVIASATAELEQWVQLGPFAVHIPPPW